MVTDTTLRVILLMWLIKKWNPQTIEAETEFLYTVLEEEIYTRIPEVMAEVPE